MSAPDQGSASAPTTPAPATLKVHEVISELQQEHGLRPDNDYAAYRQYITRRLRRLRKAAGFKYGKGRGFIAREVTGEDVAESPELLMVPLLESERAWSYAMQIKQELELAKQGHGQLTSHLLGRLRRAAAHGATFEALCGACGADAQTTLEAGAYASWMAGSLHLEQEAWGPAIENFSKALAICTELSTVGGIEQQDLFSARAEAIGQSVRYCKYNLSSGASDKDLSAKMGSLDLAGLESVVAEAKRSGEAAAGAAAFKDTVTWRGRVVGVRTEELRALLAKAQALDREAASGGGEAAGASESLTTKVIGAYGDALQLVGRQLAGLDGSAKGPRADAERADLELLRGFLGYTRALRTFARHRKLCGDLKRKWRKHERTGGGEPAVMAAEGGAGAGGGARAEDIVHVLGALKQMLEEAIKLPGMEDADELCDELGARLLAVRAQRCFFLAEAHALGQPPPPPSAADLAAVAAALAAGDTPPAPQGGRPANPRAAVALYDHAAELAGQAAELLDACVGDQARAKKAGGGEEGDMSGAGLSAALPLSAELEELAELRLAVAGAKSRAAAQAVLASGMAGGGVVVGRGGGARALLDRLGEFDAGVVPLAGGKAAALSSKVKAAKVSKSKAKRAAEHVAKAGGEVVTHRLGSVPPAFQAAECKPMLFNLAHNFLEFPDLDAKAGVAPDPSPPAAGGGLFGWFSRS